MTEANQAWPFASHQDVTPLTDEQRAEALAYEALKDRAYDFLRDNFSFEGRDWKMSVICKQAKANGFTDEEIASEGFENGIDNAFDDMSADWPDGEEYAEMGDLIEDRH